MKTPSFIKQLIKPLIAATAVAAVTASCGSHATGAADSEERRETDSRLISALQNADSSRARAIADSLALDVDDLTPSESVAVLVAFLQVHNDASAAGNRKLDLETIRKYVDVYELSMQRDRKGMEGAIAEARSANPSIDLSQLYSEFRSRLAEYDAVSGGELTVEKAADTTECAAADSTAPQPTDGSGKDLPADLRPAE